MQQDFKFGDTEEDLEKIASNDDINKSSIFKSNHSSFKNKNNLIEDRIEEGNEDLEDDCYQFKEINEIINDE